MYAVESPLRLSWKRVRHNETDEEKEKEREQRRLCCDAAVQLVASATPSEDTDETDEEKATQSSVLSSYRMYLRVNYLAHRLWKEVSMSCIYLVTTHVSLP